MPRKTGLGKAVEKSLTDMEQLVKDLDKFGTKVCRETLKRNIVSSSLKSDEKDSLLKMINEASSLSLTLSNKIDDVVDRIRSTKPKGDSRFARNVVSRFLDNTI